MVKGSQYVELANDLEINKAITYLRQRDFKQVDGSLETHSNYVAFDILPQNRAILRCLCGTLDSVL